MSVVRLHCDFERLTETEAVNSLRFDIEANTVIVGASKDIAGLQTRLRQRYGETITTERSFGGAAG